MSKASVRHTDAEWQKLLTPEPVRVARLQGTEPPFQNEYWDNHEDGVYFSVCSDTPLFDSRDKFESGTGWPSFTKPIEPLFVAVETDSSYGMIRDEVHCSDGRRPPRACLRRRPGAHRHEVLHQLGLASLHAPQAVRGLGGGARAVPVAVK
jgi:methionine-R-sulfoxide reductase